MQVTEKQQKAQEVVSSLISKCWEDSSFKAEFMSNPHATLESFTGKSIEIPEGKTVVVCDQTDSRYAYLNIPAAPSLDELELTDEQLEAVAGGEPITIGVTIFYIVTATAAGVSIGTAIGNIFD